MLPLLLAAASLFQAPEYRYLHLDVFTDRTLSGNQLAVFLEPDGLTAELMMDITREMAFSETTFVFPAEAEGTDFRVRIFGNNTGGELLVAGHPTIGTAFALAETGRIAAGTERVVFGLGIGPTPVDLEWKDGRLEFAWMQQRLPEFSRSVADADAVAAALGVEPSDIRETGLPVQQVSCGAAFLIVPMSSRAAADRATLDRQAMGKLLDAHGLVRRGVMVYTSEPGHDGATVYSRMFGFGVIEDPATGNASGPLGAYLFRHGVVSPEQARHIESRQGVRMGRPSWVHIRVLSQAGEITDIAVGGASVLVGEGTLRVGELPTSETDSLTAFLDSFVRSFNDLEWEAFRAHFADDATVFFPGGYRASRADGRDEVESGFRDVFARWRSESSGPPYLDIRPQELRVQQHEDVAVVTFHLQDAEGLNRRTLVLRNEESGWRIVHLHASSR
jgi:trans-2,3-dihydro-3-hydroxyanthranilate isomerase